MSTRREFLRNSAALGAGLAASGVVTAHAASASPRVAAAESGPGHPLRILILGGTGSSGPHTVAYALKRGHEVTIFTRGRTQPTTNREVFDHVEHLIGDREDNLTALEGRRWDAVIDNSGQNAEWTARSADLLRNATDLYLYTSSTGVYYPYLGDDITEETALVDKEPAQSNIEFWYGVMKTQSEREALGVFGADRTIISRPTYMIGPGDGSDRFIHWPVRLERGGAVLVPGRPDDPVQWIDVRDVARFAIQLIEQRKAGTYNVVGPHSPTGMRAFVHGAHAAVSSPVEWVWIPDHEFLLEHDIAYIVPWIMPTVNDYGSARVNNGRALAAGLTIRPLAESVANILHWWRSDVIAPERRAKLETAPESLLAREQEIIAKWQGRRRP